MPSDSSLLRLVEAWAKGPKSIAGCDVFEYRFALSGCVYNADLQGDPFKSSLGGLLLQEPFPLWKVGLSYDDYPQELAAWLRVEQITVKGGDLTSIETPHESTAIELAAILTLFLRRLVTVVGPVSVTVPEYYSKSPLPSPMPQPLLLKSREARIWPRLPLTVIYGADGEKYENPNAEILGVSPNALRDFFLSIAKHPQRERIVDAALLYQRAMESLFRQTDVSYLLFVCAADSIASAEMQNQNRTEAQLLEFAAAKAVKNLATELGLNSESAKKLALAAVSDPHTRQKSKRQMFREFLRTYGVGHNDAPAIFNPKIMDLFKVKDEDEAVDMAYDARSGYVHSASPFHDASLVGTTWGVPHSAFFDVMIGKKAAPSILWLERLIAHSITRYVRNEEKR